MVEFLTSLGVTCRYDSAHGAAPRGGRVPRAHGCLGACISARGAAFRGGRGAGSHEHFSPGRVDWGQYNAVSLTYTPQNFSPLFQSTRQKKIGGFVLLTEAFHVLYSIYIFIWRAIFDIYSPASRILQIFNDWTALEKVIVRPPRPFLLPPW